MAAANASAAWSGLGTESSESSWLTMYCTCSLSAAPVPTTASLREFPHAEIPLRAGDERRTARLARCERRSDVLPEPHRFDSHARGFEAIDHRADLLVDLAKTQGELDLRGRRYATVCDARELGAALRHDSPARVRQAWVNPEYDALARCHCAPLHSQTFVRYCIIPIRDANILSRFPSQETQKAAPFGAALQFHSQSRKASPPRSMLRASRARPPGRLDGRRIVHRTILLPKPRRSRR